MCELILFHQMCSKDQTQVLRLSKCLHHWAILKTEVIYEMKRSILTHSFKSFQPIISWSHLFEPVAAYEGVAEQNCSSLQQKIKGAEVPQSPWTAHPSNQGPFIKSPHTSNTLTTNFNRWTFGGS